MEHLRGPRALWINPVLHESVRVEKALHLASHNEALVVYRAAVGEDLAPAPAELGETKTVFLLGEKKAERLARVVVRGPTVFCPAFGERVHDFAWTSAGANEGTSIKRFKTLQLSASTMSIAARAGAATRGSRRIASAAAVPVASPPRFRPLAS